MVAATRALAFISGDRHVLPDPYAIRFLTPGWRLLVKNPLLRFLLFRVLRPSMAHGIVCTVLGRSQYTEDRVQAMMDESLKQLVLLGAGLDSFVFRRSDLSNLIVYEVDHPATQQLKKEKIREAGLNLPANHRFLPCDFEVDSIHDVLARSDYSAKRKTMFAWLGILPYLTPGSIDRVLAELAASAPVDSEIVFDYYDVEIFSENPPRDAARIMKAAARRGEPMITAHNPAILARVLKAQGWELVEVLSPADLERRYFSGPAVFARKPFSFSWIARGRLKSPAPLKKRAKK